MNTKKEKITILLPIYKPNINFLKETLRSIVDQTLEKKYFKLLIINELKDENLEFKVKEFLNKKINYKYIDFKAGNIAKSLQFGLSLIQTKYFARIDGDDIMEKNRLKNQLDIIEKDNQIAVLGSRVILINEKSQIIKSSLSNLYFPTNKILLLIFGAFYNNPIIHPSVLCRTDFIKESGGYFRNPPAEDYYLWSVLIKNKKIVNLKSSLTKYRIHQSQTSNKESLDYISRIRIRLRFWKALFLDGFLGSFISLLFLPFVFLPLRLFAFFFNPIIAILIKLDSFLKIAK